MRNYHRIKELLLWDLDPFLTGEPDIVSDMSVKQVRALALAGSFYKKLCPAGTSVEADDAALKKFLAINSKISTDPFDFSANSDEEATFFDYFLNHFRNALQFEVEGTNYDLAFIRENMAVGPGSAQKAVENDFISKLFEGPVSTSSEFLIPLYRSAISETGLWAEAELLRSSKFPFVIVRGGKIFFAKKNADISRTCCTPSNLGLLIQMSVGAFIEMRLEKYFGISLSTQPDKNRELARRGSITGAFGTIDLVSASDSVSWQLMLRALEESFLKRVMKECRDGTAVLPDGSEVALNMISTMGNGFTFPLQTLVFACAVKSCYEMMGLRASCSLDHHPSFTAYGVFGDDIIVDRKVYSFVCRMLNKLGFEVNDAKSFNTGPFRESCGHDYYQGHNVRGIYIKTLETHQSVYSAINRLLRWSSESGIPLVRTVNYLRGLVPKVLVPPSWSDDSGIKVPFFATSPKVSNRYWYSFRYYKRLVRSVEVPTNIGDSIRDSEVVKYPSHEDYFNSVGTILHDGLLPPLERDRDKPYSNPFGVGCGIMAGYAQRPELCLTDANVDDYLSGKIKYNYRVSLRDKFGAPPRYRLVKGEIPFWDWPGTNDSYRQSKYDCETVPTPEAHLNWKIQVMASLCFSSG